MPRRRPMFRALASWEWSRLRNAFLLPVIATWAPILGIFISIGMADLYLLGLLGVVIAFMLHGPLDSSFLHNRPLSRESWVLQRLISIAGTAALLWLAAMLFASLWGLGGRLPVGTSW